MGRSISFYALPRNYHEKHDRTLFCLNLDYEPEYEEVQDLIYKKVGGSEVKQKSVYDKKELALDDTWCPVCAIFSKEFESSLIIEERTIRHSYSNKIWSSKWNVKDFYMGTSNTSFAKRFDPKKFVREIFSYDVQYIEQKIQDLGECVRPVDKEALQETLEIVSFIKKYVHDPNILVVIQDEF